MFFAIFLEIAVAAELFGASLNSIYQLGNNLLANPSFDQPTLPAGVEWSHLTTIPGWYCENDCEVQNTLLHCQNSGKACSTQWNQGLDMDPHGAFTNLSQTLHIEEESLYLMHIEWIAPIWNPIGKSLGIHANQSSVYNFTVTSEVYSTQIQQFIINAEAGNLTLSLQMFGTSPDHLGILISNLRFQKLIPIASAEQIDQSLSSFIGLVFTNNVTQIINRLPANRVISYSFMNFLAIFDRLKLYYFHIQNLTQNSRLFLSNIYSFQVDQGNLIQDFIQECANDSAICSAIDRQYKSLLESLDSEYNYSGPDFLSKNPNGIGFFANNLDFFFYKLPAILVIYLVLSLAFKALFNLRVSFYFQKYSLCGILLLMIYEGNIENFSFYFFQEIKYFFSRTVTQKIGKIFMVYFFFVTIVFAIGGLFYLKFHYRKLVKYFTEEYSIITPYLLMMQSLEKSTFPLVLGCIHALLLENLALQTAFLGIMEGTYFVVKLMNMRALGVKFKVKVVLFSVTSLLRMGFIVTFYLYECLEGPVLMNTVHRDLIWLYLICWVIEFIYDISNFFVEVIAQIIKHCRSQNKNQPENLSKKVDKAIDKKAAVTHSTNKGKDQNRPALKLQAIAKVVKSKNARDKRSHKQEELREYVDYVIVIPFTQNKRPVVKKINNKKVLQQN